MSLFFPQVVYWKKNVFKLLARYARDINGRSPNPFTWRWQFFFLAKKKKEQEIFRSRIWACIFHVKWCTVGCIIQRHEVASKQNSLGNVSWGKEIAPLLQWICWLEKSGLIFFVFLHLLSCRWFYWTFASARGETPQGRGVSKGRVNSKERKNSFCR